MGKTGLVDEVKVKDKEAGKRVELVPVSADLVAEEISPCSSTSD